MNMMDVCMGLKDVLKDRREDIVRKWFDAVLCSYHADARGPMRKIEARFANPVGSNISEGLTGLFDAILQEVIPDDVSIFLDNIIRIRAVQEFPPSDALSFIFQLKQIVREEVGPDFLSTSKAQHELEAFDRIVDDLALFGFDIYMRCREKIYDLKAQEARNMTFRLLQKAGVLNENQE